MLCEKCGEETTQRVKYCQNCGAELSNTDNSSSNQIEIQPVQSKQSLDVQHNTINENITKDESKSFFGGIYHPWRRFFARMVDLTIFSFPIFLLFLFVMGYLFHFPQSLGGFLKITENPFINSSYIAGIAMYLVWLPFEALFLSVAGTTPGKWIFGIRVVSKTGGNISYMDALNRACLVFIQGSGLSIPIVAIITALFAYGRLTRTGTTLWDTSVSVVTHKKWGVIGVIKVIAGLFVTFVVYVIFILLAQVGALS